MYQLFLYILHHVVIYYLSFNLIWAVDAVKILWVVCVSVCVVHSEPQRDGVWRHRQCIRGTSSSRDPEHLRPLDQTTITRGTNNTRLERERYLKLTAVIMCWTLCNRCVCVCVAVIGALIGKQEGRNIEVMNSFELLFHTAEDRIQIDKEYYYTKEEQCKYTHTLLWNLWNFFTLIWQSEMKMIRQRDNSTPVKFHFRSHFKWKLLQAVKLLLDRLTLKKVYITMMFILDHF